MDWSKRSKASCPNCPEEHVGIRNIVGRIKLIYGNTAEFTIESELVQGTSIHIILPEKE